MSERPILFSGPMVRAILAGDKTQTRRVVRNLDYIGPSGGESDPENWGGFFDGRQDAGYMVLARDVHDPCGNNQSTYSIPCPYGAPGGVLWVRETWHQCPHCDRRVSYRAGGWMDTVNGERNDTDDRPLPAKCAAHGWRPPRYMPRWASRLSLDVLSVRVERVQDATDADIADEGVTPETVRALWEGATRKRRREADMHPTHCAALVHGGTTTSTLDACYPRELWRVAWTLINGAESWRATPWVWAVTFRRTP